MEKQAHYLISETAKKVEVESHVLRYWEDELEIPIKRNELGHRYYTEEDIARFREIKNLKEQGLQLKAIRMILKDGKLERLKSGENLEDFIEYPGKKEKDEKEAALQSKEENGQKVKTAGEDKPAATEEKKDKYAESGQARHMIEVIGKKEISGARQESREEKSMRLQILLQHMIAEAVRSNNRELCDDIKESVLKEMDYQFRLQEERDDERENERTRKEDEHYRRLDELLRSYSGRGRRKKEPPVKPETGDEIKPETKAEKKKEKKSRFRPGRKQTTV